MPDNVPPSNVPPTPSATPATAGAAPSTSAPEPARATDGRFEPQQWRYPADYPVAYLRGKTAEEAARITEMLYQEVQRGTSAPPAPAPALAPMRAAPGVAAPPTQDDFLANPQEATARYWEYQRQTQIEPWAQQAALNQAQMARELVRRDDPAVFERWGPEVDTLIGQVEPRFRTVETLRKIVGMVKAEHLDELAEERAQKKFAALSSTMRADGAAGSAPSGTAHSTIDFSQVGLPEDYARTLARYNVKPDTLDEFLQMTECRVRGIPLEQARQEWLEAAKKGDILTEAKVRIGPELNPAHTGGSAVPLA